MKILAGTRVSLKEDQFIDSGTALFYDEHARRFMGPVYRRFAARAKRIDVHGNRVLDVGAGSGRLSIEMAKARPDWQITGIDVSEEMLKLARQNAARGGFTDRVNFKQASAHALPFADGDFDFVTSNASLHVWADPLKVFKEIARVTAPGGCCLIWDNLRAGRLSSLLSLLGRTMGMNAAQRRLWMQAVRSSYTAGEMKAILRESVLEGASVTIVPALLELCIEWRKA